MPTGSKAWRITFHLTHCLANASDQNRNFRLGTQQDIEELVLLYRFMPSIPRETLKTQVRRPDDLNFPQLYKLELASLTRLSPDDGCNRHVGNSLK